MKLSRIYFLFALVISSISTLAQSVDEIIGKSFAVTGGIENWQALQGVYVESVVNDQGMEIPSTKTYLKDGRVLIKFTLAKEEMVQIAFDGEIAWGDNFISKKPELSNEDVIENMKREANDFPRPLLNYKENGYAVSLEGKDTIDNRLCYNIKLVKNKQMLAGKEVDDIEHYFISTTDYKLVAVESFILSGQLIGKVRRDILSDYQVVGNLLFAMKINRQIGNGNSVIIEILNIELNPQVDDSIFMFPEK